MTYLIIILKKGCEPMPIILGLFLLFIIWFQYQKRKSSKVEQDERASFIKRESEANLTRKQDISNLDYLSLPTTGLPLKNGRDKTLNHYIKTYLSYIDKKIINLSHYSNTELKEQFGLANLATLSQYDENFYSLTKLLNDWGLHLFEVNKLNEATQVLELAITIKTEITQCYVNLATIYAKQQRLEKIAFVKNSYSSLTESPSEKVLGELDKLAFQCLVEADTEPDCLPY